MRIGAGETRRGKNAEGEECPCLLPDEVRKP